MDFEKTKKHILLNLVTVPDSDSLKRQIEFCTTFQEIKDSFLTVNTEYAKYFMLLFLNEWTKAINFAAKKEKDNSKIVLKALKNAEKVFSIYGETEGFHSNGPECWDVIEQLREVISIFPEQ